MGPKVGLARPNTPRGGASASTSKPGNTASLPARNDDEVISEDTTKTLVEDYESARKEDGSTANPRQVSEYMPYPVGIGLCPFFVVSNLISGVFVDVFQLLNCVHPIMQIQPLSDGSSSSETDEESEIDEDATQQTVVSSKVPHAELRAGESEDNESEESGDRALASLVKASQDISVKRKASSPPSRSNQNPISKKQKSAVVPASAYKSNRSSRSGRKSVNYNEDADSSNENEQLTRPDDGSSSSDYDEELPIRGGKKVEEDSSETEEQSTSDDDTGRNARKRTLAKSSKVRKVAPNATRRTRASATSSPTPDGASNRGSKNHNSTEIEGALVPVNDPKKRTLRSIVRDHRSGEASASSIREKQAKKNRQMEEQRRIQELPATELKENGALKKEDDDDESDSDEDGSQMVAAPQVEIVDGKVIINEGSLAIPLDSIETGDFDILYETHTHITAHSFSNRMKTKPWTATETTLFYKAVQMYGTDFGFMAQLFPNRNRTQVKNKYKKEERTNPKKLNNALANKVPMDFEEFEAALKATKKEAKKGKKKKGADLYSSDDASDEGDEEERSRPSGASVEEEDGDEEDKSGARK